MLLLLVGLACLVAKNEGRLLLVVPPKFAAVVAGGVGAEVGNAGLDCWLEVR